MKPSIGKYEGNNIYIDIPRLMKTKLLVTANSGAGKSWLLRRIFEQTFKSVQQIIIDPEGEFHTLREKYDYIICAPKDADVIATPATAKLLSHRLLETGVSAIIDIFEMSPDERQRFVKTFCDSLVNAPKKLWRPVLVGLDEAHEYCPEKSKSDCTGSVISLGSKGRKRGFCLLAATQRLAKLNKDLAAEMNNKLVGRMILDVDRKRAAEELGFSQREDIQGLRLLGEGEFYCFGPALIDDVIKVKVGDVQTTHPDPSRHIIVEPTPPTAKIKKILSELQDLPQQAQQELQTINDFRLELASLKRELANALKNQAPAKEKIVEVQVVDDVMLEQIEDVIALHWGETKKTLETAEAVMDEVFVLGRDNFEKMMAIIKNSRKKKPDNPAVKNTFSPCATIAPDRKSSSPGSIRLGPGEKKILTIAGQYPDGVSREQISVMANYKRSSRNTYIQKLAANGLINVSGGKIAITPAGRDELGPLFDPLPTGRALREYWMRELSGGEQVLLSYIMTAWPASVSRDELSDKAGYKRSSRNTYLQKLRARELITVDGDQVKASEVLFNE